MRKCRLFCTRLLLAQKHDLESHVFAWKVFILTKKKLFMVANHRGVVSAKTIMQYSGLSKIFKNILVLLASPVNCICNQPCIFCYISTKIGRKCDRNKISINSAHYNGNLW